MNTSYFPLVLIALIMLVVGFLSGYAYRSSAQPHQVTQTTTVAEVRTITEVSPVYSTITIPVTTTAEVVKEVTMVETRVITETTTKFERLLTITYVEPITITSTAYTIPRLVLSFPGDPSAEVDTNSDGVYDVFVEINPWNARSFRGQQMIVYDRLQNQFEVVFNLTDVTPPEWTNGYPEIYIGRKPWGGRYYNGFNVRFPMKVKDANPFVISFYVCVLELDPRVNFNIAADAWIVREEVALRPGTAPGKGDLEIMVWLFNQNLGPAGRRVGEVAIPIVLNGSRTEAVFEVWRHDSVEWGGWQYIAFKPRDWSHRCGHVAYNPVDFVKAAAKYATFDISEYYLLGWEIGTEWGARTSGGVAVFRWVIKDFIAVPGATI